MPEVEPAEPVTEVCTVESAAVAPLGPEDVKSSESQKVTSVERIIFDVLVGP